MKILNLYAGIGGNRKLWDNSHDITAVEYNQDIANIYKDFFPNDNVIIADAHEYLLKHYKEYDFIWSSPPCPTHSRIRMCGVLSKKCNALYPDMKLYQEIIFLKHFMPKNKKWVIENVIPYYDYLIKPDIIFGKHPFWVNYLIENKIFSKISIMHNKYCEKTIKGNDTLYGFNIKKYNLNINKKRQILRNLVNPEIGKYILDQAMNIKTSKQEELF
jgi:DNA (cytosine-5)-methyltransferase 1